MQNGSKNIDNLREKLDEIDNKLLDLLSSRINIVKEIGEIKKAHNLSIRDPKREEEILSRLREKSRNLDIDPVGLEKLWRTLFEIAYKIEK